MVSAGDVCWGALHDIRRFHPPPGVFDGVCFGDPCQSFSGYANLLRSKGMTTRFGDLSKEALRVVREAQPRWFLRENIVKARPLKLEGYAISDFTLDNADLGAEQERLRRFWFGVRGRDPRRSFLPGGQKIVDQLRRGEIQQARRDASVRTRVSMAQMLRAQGLPTDFFRHSPFTAQGQHRLLGNAVALPVAVALARAVVESLEGSST